MPRIMIAQSAKRPYAPSWMDRLIDLIEDLPIPAWLFYVLTFLAISLIESALFWLRGVYPFPQVEPVYLISLLWAVIQLFLFHYLRNAASLGIDGFRSALALGEKEFADLKYRFTITPALTGWVITLIGAVIAIAGGEGYRGYLGAEMFDGPNVFLTWPLAILLPTLLLAFLVRAGNTYWMASRLYSKVKTINMFDLSPLFGLSVFTYRMGMLTVILALLSLITNSSFLTGTNQASADAVYFMVLDATIGLAAFILPLLGLHQRLVGEKQKLAAQNAHYLNRIFDRLQSRIGKGSIKNIGDLRTSAAALVDVREEIKKLPTWPWETGTLRNFLTALAAPMTIWIIQQILLRTVVN
jgi:hypothetical protein